MSAARPQLIFVCTGNICRSPMAASLLRRHLGPHAAWRVCSAGLAACNGQPITPAANAFLRAQGLDAGDHRSRRLTAEMVDAADLIVVMTSEQAAEIARRFPAAAGRVRLLSSFDHDSRRGLDIRDPLGGGLDEYRRVGEEIENALLGLILHLQTPPPGAAANR